VPLSTTFAVAVADDAQAHVKVQEEMKWLSFAQTWSVIKRHKTRF
jgi:hypothetical protein